MKFEISTGESVSLTPDQATLLLYMCDGSDQGADRSIACFCESNECSHPIRETSTANSLVRKGLATTAGNRFVACTVPLVTGRLYICTLEGYWLGDSLRILNRQGKLPERKIGSYGVRTHDYTKHNVKGKS